MLTIYKYEIEIEDYFEIRLPEDYKILSIQTQRDKICLWVLVNPNNKTILCKFRLARTGYPINDDIDYFIGTFQLYDGDIVFHLFKLKD